MNPGQEDGMGNRAIAGMFEAGAEIFWAAHTQGQPSAEQALAALDAIGNRFRGADANSSDDMYDPTSPLGRMVALAFHATPHELNTTENEETLECPWYDGPHTRFRARCAFC